MIQRLYIRDFAVVDEMDLSFGDGLNLLTGETGSGKSIIVDAIGVALGERADSEIVRTGCEKAIVEIVLDVSSSPDALRLMDEAGLESEDGLLIVSREIQRSGKSQCRINGRASTLSLLKSITERLVDTHGQHEHQFLLRPERHIEVIDAWCGDEASPLRRRVSDGFAELRRKKDELHQLRADERDRARMMDLYTFQIREIDDANLSPDEEEMLVADKNRLANAEKLNSAASRAFELIGDRMQDDRCALDALSEAVGALECISGVDSTLDVLVEQLQASLYQVEDAARELRNYRDVVEFNPERLESVEDRLNLIRGLKKKYGETVAEVIEYGAGLTSKLDGLINSDERAAQLESLIDDIQRKTLEDANNLSEVRRKGAEVFSRSIELELAALSMPHAVFEVSCIPQGLDSTGIDNVELLISANPGEPPRPLAKIASGGEMSRVMLAIKSVMAGVDHIPTLVFDEIDVGVGGRTAEVIGRKVSSLSRNAQILCITHLPQIACLPGDHFSIEKQLSDNRTVVRVRKLQDDERVEEVARMLSGANPSGTAMQHAKEMLGVVNTHQ